MVEFPGAYGASIYALAGVQQIIKKLVEKGILDAAEARALFDTIHQETQAIPNKAADEANKIRPYIVPPS